MSYKYFCYDSDSGFETYKTPEEAKKAAQDAIDYYRDHADEGWDEEVSNVCWGEINQHTVETMNITNKEAEDRGMWFNPSLDGISDYGLADIE